MMSIYKDLMTINEEPVKLIVLVANSMRLIYQVKLLDRKGYTVHRNNPTEPSQYGSDVLSLPVPVVSSSTPSWHQ